MLILPSLHEIDKALAERSLVEYAKQAWQVVEPGTTYVHGWHIEAICEHLEAVTRGEILNLIINIPPRYMKSLLTSVFWPTWEWTFQPASRWLFMSYADQLAIRDSLKCRRIIQSGWYQRNWGHVFTLTGDQNQKTRFENNHTGFRVAAGVGGLGTGEGGNRIVVDDPIKAQDAHSETIRQSVITWWDETMSTRLNDPNKSARVIIMQRLHEEDLTGHILAKMEAGGVRYEHLCLPAEYEPNGRVTSIGWSDPRREAGELLWPERFDREAIGNLKKSLGSYAAAGQLQQRPSPAEGGMLKRVWWRFWIPKGANLPPVKTPLDNGNLFEHPQVELPETFDEQIQSWDMAFKDTKQSDFVAGQVWGRVGANRFLLDQKMERLDIVASIRAVETMTVKWPETHAKIVEDKANGPAIIAMLRDKIPGLIAFDPKSGKEARVSAVSPVIEAGNVYLPHPQIARWIDGLIDRAAAFPNAAHDDDIDAMTQALLRWQVRGKVLVAAA